MVALERIIEQTCSDEWQHFITNELKKPSMQFIATLQNFSKNAPFLSHEDYLLINHEITSSILKLNIPNQNHWCYPQSLKFLPINIYMTCFDYLQRKSIEYWDCIKNNSTHVI